MSAQEPPGVLPPEVRKCLPYLLLATAVFLAYCNVYDNVMLFDDNIVITLNTFLKSWSAFGQLVTGSTISGAHVDGGFYRPMQMVLYFFIYQIDGTNPPLYHFLNVALHAANACLVLGLGRRLGFNPRAAFFAALIWGLHPLHTEVIAYVSGTADPLFTFFCLLGLVILLPDFSWRKIIAAIPVFILALLSKEAAVVFPALAVCCILLHNETRLKPAFYIRTWPLWTIAIAYAIWRMTASGFDGPLAYDKVFDQRDFYNLRLYADNFSYRLYTFFATLPDYLRLLIWPTGLHMERTFPVFVSLRPIETWEGIGICIVCAGQIVWGRGKRGVPLSWGLLWFATAHFLNTGLIFPMNSQFLEHWMYLPSIGLFLGLAETASNALTRWPKAKPAAAGAMLVIATIYGFMTFEQNMLWHDPFVFYANIFKYGEPSARAHNNLALAYMEKQNYPAAISEFHKAIDLTDTYPETRHNLAIALLQLPDAEAHLPEIIADLNRAVEISPDFYRAWDVLAEIYAHTGDHAKEAECRKKEAEILNRPN